MLYSGLTVQQLFFPVFVYFPFNLPQQKETAVLTVGTSAQDLLTGQYKNIKRRLIKGKYKMYFNKNVFRKS